MPRSDRDKGVASLNWFLPAVGIILAVLLAWGVGYLQAREAERRQQTPADYRQSAETDAKRSCVSGHAASMFECVYKKVESSKEQAQAEQDLSAQQRAASAGLAAAILTAFTLFVTGLGVWFVKRTLDATLEAVKDTSEATKAMREQNRIANDQSRAWISITASPEKVVVTENSVKFYYSIGMKNVGSTVATNIDVKHDIVDGLGERVTHEIAKRMSKWRRRERKDGAGLMPNESVSTSIWSFQAKDSFETSSDGTIIYPVLLVAAWYSTTNDTAEHLSRRTFRFVEKRDPSDFLTGMLADDPVVPWVRLNIPVQTSDKLGFESFGGVAT